MLSFEKQEEEVVGCRREISVVPHGFCPSDLQQNDAGAFPELVAAGFPQSSVVTGFLCHALCYFSQIIFGCSFQSRWHLRIKNTLRQMSIPLLPVWSIDKMLDQQVSTPGSILPTNQKEMFLFHWGIYFWLCGIGKQKRAPEIVAMLGIQCVQVDRLFRIPLSYCRDDICLGAMGFSYFTSREQSQKSLVICFLCAQNAGRLKYRDQCHCW